VTNGIYEIIRSKYLKEKKGLLERKDLSKIWLSHISRDPLNPKIQLSKKKSKIQKYS
jgi:hypothetical protein